MQLKIASTIEESAENRPLTRVECTPLKLLAKAIEIYDRCEYSGSVEGIYIYGSRIICTTRGETTNGNIRDTRITIEDALSKHRIARAHLSSTCHSHDLFSQSLCHSAEFAAAILVVSLRIPTRSFAIERGKTSDHQLLLHCVSHSISR